VPGRSQENAIPVFFRDVRFYGGDTIRLTAEKRVGAKAGIGV
jgi:hypothetical protein